MDLKVITSTVGSPSTASAFLVSVQRKWARKKGRSFRERQKAPSPQKPWQPLPGPSLSQGHGSLLRFLLLSVLLLLFVLLLLSILLLLSVLLLLIFFLLLNLRQLPELRSKAGGEVACTLPRIHLLTPIFSTMDCDPPPPAPETRP